MTKTTTMSPCILPAALLLGILAAAGGHASEAQAAPEDAPQVSSGEDFERATALTRELASLLLTLPPEQRAELLALWGSLTTQSEADPRASGGPIPVESSSEPGVEGAPRISAEESSVLKPEPQLEVAAGPPVPPESGSGQAVTTPTGIVPACGNLAILDSDSDGWVSGRDRFWRHLRLWRDDGDGAIERDEVKTLFARDIRRLNVRLTSYITSKDREGGVWVEDVVFLDILGKRGRDVLVVEAGALARSGELWLEDESGRRIEELQPLSGGLSWRTSDGRAVRMLCR